ncbi:MAG: hypothetical protein FWD26_03835 [Treponema sp.]|nr:hypothetical protein [Treponema sp.]
MKQGNEIKGFWWLPEQPENRTAGVLYKSNEGTHLLELFGNIEGKRFFTTSNKYPIINGFSSKGRKYTLFDTFIKNQTSSAPGFTEITILANIVLENILLGKKEDLKLKAISTSFLFLDDWIMINGFSRSDNCSAKTKIEYKLPSSIEYDINKEFCLKINFQCFPSPSVINTKEVAVKQTVEIKIEGSENNLDYYMEKIYIFKCLLMLFINNYTNTSNIRVEAIGENNEHIIVPIYFSDDKQKINKKEMIFTEFIATYSNIKDEFLDILNYWYSSYNKLSNSYSLFFDTSFKSGLNLENKFLNLINALESYHRNNNNFVSSYMDKEEYLSGMYHKLIKNIPSSIEQDFQEALKSRIKFGYEYSLRRRLKELFSSNNNFLNNFIYDAEILQKEIIDSRNYYTHYDEKSKFVKDGIELYYLCEKIIVIFISLLLFDLKFSNDDIIGILKNQEKMQRIIRISSK